MHKTIEQLMGVIIFVTEEGTGVKVKGCREWLNRPRGDFADTRIPKRGETWQFQFEVVEKADGQTVRFVREEEYLGTFEPVPIPPPPDGPAVVQYPIPERPAYEDAEWFWLIRDERGGVYAQTYQEYLTSDAWRRRADRRLLEDGHKCQAQLPGCTTAASQVHHLNYTHLGCEPMWDLCSICSDCHTMLTSIDRKKPLPQRTD